MKKLFLIISVIGLLALILMINGCTTIVPVEIPNIKKVTSESTIIKADAIYSLQLYVVNPTSNTFTGYVYFKIDEKCLKKANYGDELNQSIEVLPNKDYGIVKEFDYKGKISRGSGYYEIEEIPNCIQNPLQISVYLYDKSGDLRDNENFFLTIIE